MGLGVLLACGAALCFVATRRGRRKPPASLMSPPPAPEPKTLAEELLEQYVSDDPCPGHFYQIQPHDTPTGVAAQALGADAAEENLIDYIHCWASGPNYNMPMFATPSTSKTFPHRLLVPGKRLGVRVAFLPRNDDALGAMLEGRLPRRTVDPDTGAPRGVGRSYGLLWLPPVDEEYSCASFEWPDGSSTIDPPPALLEMLR